MQSGDKIMYQYGDIIEFMYEGEVMKTVAGPSTNELIEKGIILKIIRDEVVIYGKEEK